MELKVLYSRPVLTVSLTLLSLIVLYVIYQYVEKFTYEGSVNSKEGEEYEKEMEKDNNYVSPSQQTPMTEGVSYEPEAKDMAQQEEELLRKSQELTDKSLLPSDDNDEYSLLSKNFLANTFDIGMESRGSSLQVPNLQLRSDPVVPKVDGLTPFNNSTAEQDTLRKKFEIGE